MVLIAAYETTLSDSGVELNRVNTQVSEGVEEYASLESTVKSINMELDAIQSQIDLADTDRQSLQDALAKLKTRLGTHNVRAIGAVCTLAIIVI